MRVLFLLSGVIWISSCDVSDPWSRNVLRLTVGIASLVAYEVIHRPEVA